jgi:glutamate synthase domain-containing protein 3
MLGTGAGNDIQLESLKPVHNFDLEKSKVRDLNQALHEFNGSQENSEWQVINPKGRHALAVGIDARVKVNIIGHAGYYCAGMNKQASVTVNGNVGPGVAENMMSGVVHVTGSASQYAGATAHGGLLLIDGDASSRCGISMKGVDIVVKGSVGHMSAFMAQSGRLVVCGDAGDALGDSLYEARIYVKGEVASLGADCIEKPMRAEHKKELAELLETAGVTNADVASFKRYGSARKLYNFDIDNVDAY